MSWIYLAVGAQLLVAIAIVIDKLLLAAKPVKPLAYAFGVALLSAFALGLVPFGVSVPAMGYVPLIIATGVAQFLALVFFFRAVQGHDPSLAAAKTGTFVVLSTFLFSHIFGTSSKLPLDIYAVTLMAAGMLVLGFLGRSIFLYTVAAGVSGGLSFALLKGLLDGLGFVDGVFWTRLALALSACALLLVPKARNHIVGSWRKAPRRTGPGLVLSKVMAGGGFLLMYYAIRLGDVVTVSALESIRFAFVLGLALLLERWLPHGGESATPHILLGKIAGIALIISGFLELIL
jgi:drug/metabolite transporter (DMT)-like permease